MLGAASCELCGWLLWRIALWDVAFRGSAPEGPPEVDSTFSQTASTVFEILPEHEARFLVCGLTMPMVLEMSVAVGSETCAIV